MPNVLNAQGLTTASQSELLTYYSTALQTIFGPNINIDSDSPDGQWINILIQATLDVEDLLTQIYNSFDPDNAVGTQLDQRCAINGIERQAGTYSVTNVTLILTQSINLYGLDQSAQSVFTVSDNAGNQWQLQTTQLGVGPGTFSYSFQASSPGATLTTPNTITVPVSVLLGVLSINNPSAQTVIGINEETDAALRIRRQQSVSIASQGYLQGLLAALLNINGITSAFVYENTTNSTDANNIPGHSIWVIVAGAPSPALSTAWSSTVTYSYGQITSSAGVNYISWQNNNLNNAVSNTAFWGVYNAVAQAIYSKRNAGCGMFGGTTYTVTQIDGTQFIISWDTVVPQNLYIRFTVTSLNGVNQPNYAGIRSGLPALFIPGVNAEVNINQLATLIQQIDPNSLVTNAGFSLALSKVATLSGVAASGTFKFNYGGNATAAINWNDAVSTIQSKLRAVTGLGAATVTGSIASQSLTITLNVTSAVSLITVTANSLATVGSVAITFLFNETYQNTLTPTAKNNQFAVASNQIIILPLLLSPATATVKVSTTLQLTGLGGYGSYTYALTVNNSGGSINSSSGLYTAGTTPSADTASVTDAFGVTATATLTVTS